MKIVFLTNDNFFCFTFVKDLIERRKNEIELIVFSSALIQKRGTFDSIMRSFKNTGVRHTIFKLLIYGIFRTLRIICTLLPLIPNKYSLYLWAKQNKIKYLFSNNINDLEILQKIKVISPDLIVAANMNQIIKKPLLEIPPKGCINTHCGSLPRYGGMSPYVWAMANNEEHSAATIHYMEEGLDEGDIIVQEIVKIKKNDSAFSLFYRCCQKACKLLVKVVEDIEAGTVTSYKQDLSKKTYFSWPTKECVKNLHKNGYRLAKITDFTSAIFNQKPRVD